MANQLNKGDVFVDGQVVTATRLNNLVDLATALEGLISAQTALTPAVATDYVLVLRPGSPNLIRKVLISALPGAGTVTSVGLVANPTSVFGVAGTPVTASGNITLSMDNQTANFLLAGPASGSAAAPAFRRLASADMAITAQAIPASLIDLTTGNVFYKQLTATPTTFHLANGASGQVIKVWVQQIAGGGGVLHWFADGTGGVIRWPGGVEPVLTAGSSHIDIFEFLCIGSNSYYGIRWGADMSL